MNLSKSKITMHWSQLAGPRPTADAFEWLQGDFATTPTSELELVGPCKDLFGSHLVGRVLHAAFERGLGRHQPWTCKNLSESETFAVNQAAKIFKRGVRVEGPEGQKIEQPTAGVSTIEFFDDIQSLFASKELGDVILVDKNVYDLWQRYLPDHVLCFSVSEHVKNMRIAAEIAKLIPAATKRLIIVGGGVLGDIAGFVAGLKNLQTIYVPTTLLAMADSSVGGKTGVNAGRFGKNQLGLFHPPTEVRICSGWLSTLAERELRSGMVECVKHAMLSGDEILWNQLIKIAKDRTWIEVGPLLPKIVSVKAAVVERDPFEFGERVILNLGHTMGHAVETLSLEVDGKDALTHGEAVAVGLCHTLQLSKKQTGFTDADRYIRDLRDSGLVPVLSASFQKRIGDLPKLLTGDKKNLGQNIHWVLMEKFGVVARRSDGGWTIPILNNSDASILSCS